MKIKNRCALTATEIFVINCTLKLIINGPIDSIFTSSVNRAIHFINCMFHNNRAFLIVIIVEQRKSYACKIVDQLGLAKNVALVAANIIIIYEISVY